MKIGKKRHPAGRLQLSQEYVGESFSVEGINELVVIEALGETENVADEGITAVHKECLVSGITPGIILAILLAITIFIISARNPSLAPPGPKTSWSAKIRVLPGLLEAAGSEDDELRSQAQRAILEAGDREVMLLREGLVQTSRSLRRFSLEHLLAGAQVALVEGIMGGQLTKTGTAEALAIVQTLLSPSRPFWLRLGRRLARDPGAHGLDVLAEAMVDPRLQAGARRAWDSLRPRLFDRLLDALWEEEMALARQAAGLALQMGEAYIGPLLAAFDAAPRENRRAARCLLRLLLLGEGVPGLETPTALETVEQAGRVQAELLPPRNGYPLSSIPVIQRADGRQMFLLVQGVPYPLRLEGPAMAPGTGKAYVVVNTDDVPVRPSHMQALRGASDARWDLEFTVVPDTETIDRMTLHLLVDKRGRGWPADYDLFVCDASVMAGLDAVEGGV